MKKLLTIVLLVVGLAGSATVVRLAPNFSWEGPGRANNLRAVRGQPVVLLIAKNTRVQAFKAQVKVLHEIYQEFASRKVIFAAALAEGSDTIHSDIPFAIASNGAQIAADYGVNDKFNIVIIARDGNVDYQTDRVIAASRVRDVMANSFVEQSDRRQ